MTDGTDAVVEALHEPAAPPRRPAVRQLPKWEADARDRVRVAVRRFARPLADLIARDANEGDTRLLVTDFLCDGLGYDKYEDLTTEYQVKGEFADYGVRIAKQLVAFIEVKRCTTRLGAKHLRQVEMYAVNEGVEWMILTNGQVWQVWHLTAGLPVELTMALEVDLLGEGGPTQKAEVLFYLSTESGRRARDHPADIQGMSQVLDDDVRSVMSATEQAGRSARLDGADIQPGRRAQLHP